MLNVGLNIFSAEQCYSVTCALQLLKLSVKKGTPVLHEKTEGSSKDRRYDPH